MIGRTISHYKIIEKTAEGGMGLVFKAHDINLDRFAAVKSLNREAFGGEKLKMRFVRPEF